MNDGKTGNRTSDNDGRRTFTYTATERLYQVYDNGTLVATYSYNGLGQPGRLG